MIFFFVPRTEVLYNDESQLQKLVMKLKEMEVRRIHCSYLAHREFSLLHELKNSKNLDVDLREQHDYLWRI